MQRSHVSSCGPAITVTSRVGRGARATSLELHARSPRFARVVSASAIGGDSPFSDSNQQNIAGIADGLGNMPQSNLTTQFALDMESLTMAMHSNDAIEGLLDSFMANTAS